MHTRLLAVDLAFLFGAYVVVHTSALAIVRRARVARDDRRKAGRS